MEFPIPGDRPSEETEISDLQTAKIALHGALAMVRNLQDVNQRLKGEIQDTLQREKAALLRASAAQAEQEKATAALEQQKAYYQAYESQLRTEARQEANKESLERWDRQTLRLKGEIEALQIALKHKDDDTQRLHADLAQKEAALSQALQEHTQALLRVRNDASAAYDKLEAKKREEIRQAIRLQETEIQKQWAERLQYFQVRTEHLERVLAEQEHRMSQEFQQRLKEIAEQHVAREQETWDQLQKIRATTEAEIEQRVAQRCQLLEEDHRALLLAQEKRFMRQVEEAHIKERQALERAEAKMAELEAQVMRRKSELQADFERRESERLAHFEQERLRLESQWQERLTALQRERDAAMASARQAERQALERMQQELSQTRAADEALLGEKLRAMREDFLRFERAAEARKRESEAGLLEQFAAEKRDLLAAHADDVQAQHQMFAKKLVEQAAEHDQKWRALHEQFRLATLETQKLQTLLQDTRAALQKASGQKEDVTAELQAARLEQNALRTALAAQEATLQRLQAALRSAEQSAAKPAPEARPASDQQMLEDWIFGFAHQIRNPLAIIRTTAEALSNGKAQGPAAASAFGGILQSVDGLQDRLMHFIDFAKPLEPAHRPIRLNELMEKSLGVLHERLRRAEVVVETAYDADLPLVTADPEQVQSIFVALLENAIDASPARSSITVRIHHEPSHHAVTVGIQDAGAGISLSHLNDIGKPFFTTKAGHAGLGLAHVKRVLRLYGGQLLIESPPGQGAQVQCRLPVSTPEAG